MKNKKQIVLLWMFLVTIFITACGTPGESENHTEQLESGEVLNSIEQPVVNLKNVEKGVLITWNEIAGVDGYLVYSRVAGGKFQRIATITDPLTVQYIDSEAQVGTSYDYAVRAFCGDQKSNYEAVNITTGIWEPEIDVVYIEPNMNISWDVIHGCSGYIVYRKIDEENYEVLSIINDSENTLYIDENLPHGEIYTYAVKSFIGEEKSTYTGVEVASISEPVVNVKDMDSGIEIVWNEIEGAEGYYVYRKEDGGKYEVIQKLENAKLTTYLDADVSAGKKYFYTVRAYLGEQKSTYTDASITKELEQVKVSMKNSDSGVQIAWNKVDFAEGYYVYKKEEGEEEYSLINTVTDITITNYIDQQVENGKTYYYAVRAYVGDMQSSYAGSTITVANN